MTGAGWADRDEPERDDAGRDNADRDAADRDAADRDDEPGRRLLAEATALVAALQASGRTHDGSQCRVCPICRALALLQRVRPEAVEHLAGALTEVAAALREVLAPPAGTPEPPPWAGGPASAANAAGRARPDPVQRIDITD